VIPRGGTHASFTVATGAGGGEREGKFPHERARTGTSLRRNPRNPPYLARRGARGLSDGGRLKARVCCLLRISPSLGRSNKIQIAINPRERDDAAEPALWIAATAAIVPVITVPRDILLLGHREGGREGKQLLLPSAAGICHDCFQ
jgi:hypothetical protein